MPASATAGRRRRCPIGYIILSGCGAGYPAFDPARHHLIFGQTFMSQLHPVPLLAVAAVRIPASIVRLVRQVPLAYVALF